MKITFLLRCACVLLTIFVSAQAAADPLTDAKNAENQGRVREAVEHYTVALQSSPDGSEQERSLREKIIDLASRLKPPPAVPEEARRYMGRGQAAVGLAKTPEDFGRAAAEFQRAVRMAPWLADAYYNLGVVQEKGGRLDEAIRSFKLYLRASPSASDAEQVHTRLYGLEYKAETAETEKRGTQQRASEEMRRKLARFNGQFEDNENFYLGTAGESSLEIKEVGFKGYDANGQFRKFYYDSGFRAVFRLSLADNRVSGTYYQPLFSSTHSVSGVLNADGSLRLDYTESSGRPPSYKDSDGIVFREPQVNNKTTVLRPPR